VEPLLHAPDDLAVRLSGLMLGDEHRLGRRLARAQGLDDAERAAALADVAADVAAAERTVARRRAAVPAIAYPESLPITDRHDQLLATIRDHQVVVVAGETGSGKSTQLPKLCLELGRGVRGLIGHTQPRRLAARTVAARIAEELGGEIGGVVGYTVRFSERVGDGTLVRLMTDGILLAELERDRMLRRYDTLIVDEAHERSLNIDFILGYLTGLLPRRPDLKVLVTSATIDTERFARHFGAPVVEVTGRTYPVEVRYRPFGGDADGDNGDGGGNGNGGVNGDGGGKGAGSGDGRDQTDAVRAAVAELRAEGPGDVLVFLSGEREIRDTAAALTDSGTAADPDTEVLPLYARLSVAEQQRAFRSHRGRRIVLATNVAETSITVPGVRYVVDAGTARISRYNRRTKVQRLPIEPISQASADQRAGRCGRVAPGICIRLYGEDDHLARPEFTEPEILRTNLASVILQMAALGLGDVESFPFVDPPDAHAVRDAVNLLVELGAMQPDRTLTPTGRRLARLPIDPRFGRMILEADANGCVREVIVLAAGLSIQDPRERPTGKEAEADELHARFADPHSDFVTLLNLWRYLDTEQRARSSNQFRRLCRTEHLNHLRVREWQDVVRQLREVTHELGIRRNTQPADAERVHRSLLAGLLSHVGMYDRTNRDHVGARQAHFAVAPGSVLFKRAPRWVMAGELVETNRTWARMVARIEPAWVEPLARHLVRRSHGEPRWDAAHGSAVTTERLTLYGLPIVAARDVPLGQVDPAGARRLFIRHALVDGEWATHHRFAAENQQRFDEVQALEDRARRRDLLVADDAIVDFFDRRLGAEVVSARHFDRWWNDARRDDPDLLTFTLADLLDPAAEPVEPAAFPTTWTHDDLVLDVSYAFEPGAADDGVTVHVPLTVLNRVGPGGFDWQVPGHRLELVTTLIRSLPKAVRRDLVPVPERAREALATVGPDDGPLLAALARALSRNTGASVTASDFDLARVADHLRVRFQVEGSSGAVVASGRDLAELQRRLAEPARRAVAAAAPLRERSGLRSWDLGALDPVVDVASGGHTVRGYPALVDEGDAVGVRIMTTAAGQADATWAGTRRLLLLGLPGARRDVERRLRSVPALAATTAPYPGVAELTQDCLAAAADRVIETQGGPAWDAAAFAALAAAARSRLGPLAVGAAGQAARLVAAAQALDARLRATRAPVLQPAVDDMLTQLGWLVRPAFVSLIGLQRLLDVGRYLEAMRVRLDKLAERPGRDRELMERIHVLERGYREARDGLSPERRDGADVADVRWLLEELRVSFFAQALGTARPVSEPRVRRALARLG
jgi:ATP-dependent helicase HrpA